MKLNILGVGHCLFHDTRFGMLEDCPECVREAAKTKREAYCETHGETFETECPACEMWKANILDQDPDASDFAKHAIRFENKATGRVFYTLGELGGAIKHPAFAEHRAMLRRESDREYLSKMPKPSRPAPPMPETAPQSGGVKFDHGKPPVSLVDRHAIEQIANVLAFGAQKYAAHNWRQGINYSRLLDAALRHLFAFADGEDKDPESGLSHIAHAGCCVVFLLGMINTRPELDDRFKAATK